MSDHAQHETSPTLIGRIQTSPRDQSAWQEFERRYAEMIRRWCRHWGLQQSDADDLTQDVLLSLCKQIERFRYDPDRRFRGWLKTVARRAWCDFLEKQRRRAVGSGETEVIRLLERQDVEDDFSLRLEQEWQRELLETAMRSVQQRIQPHTWEAFRLQTQEGLSGAQVAEQLQMNVGAVWVACSKVRKRIQEEVRRLESLEQDHVDAP